MNKNNIISWLLALFLVGGLISLIVISNFFMLVFLVCNILLGIYILKLAINEILTNKTPK